MANSHIYMTQTQIHELFEQQGRKPKDLTKSLIIPSFGELLVPDASPQFNGATSQTFFQPDFIVTAKRDTTAASLSQAFSHSDSLKDGMIQISKTEYDKLLQDQRLLQEIQSQTKSQVKDLKDITEQQNQLIQRLQKQVLQQKESQKKQQQHIFDLLQNVKILEKENHALQENLLSTKMTIQDQIKEYQQSRIDLERIKIELLRKTDEIQMLSSKVDQSSDLNRQKQSKSAIRGAQVSFESPLKYKQQSYAAINFHPTNQRSFSSHIKPRIIIQ
ncbi:hypothetical protein pb186bvf_010825 [Paramecium bursaria]